jgi:Holliday junction resolvase RusA-like endonuclease
VSFVGTFDGATSVTHLEPPVSPLEVSFWVPGIPVAQGSKGYFNGRMVETNKGLYPWRRLVEQTAGIAMRGHHPIPAHVPVFVNLDFYLPRPKTVTREWPTVKPDVDKLLRAVLDSLTVAGVYADDAQVVKSVPIKRYAVDSPGVQVRVGSVA